MDIRDILKSFDQLSEATTATDKGTVHKADLGGYGNKHGSEDVTDQYGKPVGRMSLGKLGAQNEPKRGKGRPPNPDKAKSYDSSALNKAMGIGKAPTPKGKPSVKHSLKEYFDQMDQALVEADAYTTAPMPGAVAVKDASGKVVATAKNPQAAAAFQKGDITLGGGGMTEDQPTGSVPDTAKIKTGLDNLKGAMQMPGGQSIDSTKLSSTLAGTKSGQSFDASAQREIQKLLPGITAALSNPNTAGLIKQAIATAQKQQSQPSQSQPNTVQGQLDEISPELASRVAAKRANQVDQMAYGVKDPLANDQIRAAHDQVNKNWDQAVKRGATNDMAADALIKVQNEPPVPLRSGGQTTPTPQGFKNPQVQYEGDVGKHNNATTGFDALVRKLTPKYGEKAAKKIAGSQLKKIGEAEAPPTAFQSSPLTFEGKKGVNPFAKKDESDKKKLPSMAHIKKMCQDGKSLAEICKMHPDCDRAELKKMVADCKKTLDEGSMPMKKVDGKSVPAFAADGKGKNDLTKKSDIDSKRKSQVDAAGKAFKDADEYKKSGGSSKKKVKEGMEHHLQAARLEGKSHALRKMPYNCTHDNMEEARCYHDGFKEGLDECYGQMPILGRTAVDEMGSEVGTMASYGAHTPTMEDDMYEMDKTSYMKQQAIKTPGDTFKAFGQTMSDKDVLDELAFEALDKQLNAILEGKEVSEGMTVSISKGQQGSPDSVSVSAQDGEADQLLSIIKSAGMGLFGGDEHNGYGAPQGSAGAHGGISVVDDHDGMMALMKKLTGGGDMQGSGDYEDEEGHEGHSYEGEEDSCNECGYMESKCQCDHGDEQVVDEVESRDQMAYEVAEANAPDSGAAETAADDASEAGEDAALATDDAAQDEEEGEVYSSPTNEAEDETGEEAGKEKVDEGTCKKCDCNPCKCETMSESSFFNLFRKISMLSEESTEKKDEKAEKAGKKVAKDIEYDEGHTGKDDNKAEKAGKEVKKDIEYDDKKDKKVDESYANSADDTFEADIDFMTKVISGGLNKQKSTGQTTVPVINGQKSRMGVDGLGSPMKESNDLLKDYRKLSGL
jgi:hypothetical protein